ncbi:Pvc16 family protein [Piscinibacter sakaiensis]|uniref:Pvc16 family protein n=1 Tax=Piscinibacter sakaiensis TaxID=1547922 RepID=UPI00372D4C6C
MTQLDQHLRRCFQMNEDLARLSHLLERDGSPVPQCDNKVVVFLVGIEANDNSRQVMDAETGGFARRGSSSPAKWNLLVMFAANFDGNNYPEALKLLSSTIQFIEECPVLNRDNAPSLDPQVGKLLLSIQNMPVPEVASLWNMHNNGRYLPSVLCRVQVLGYMSEA